MAVDFGSVQDATRQVLKSYPNTRSDDGALVSKVIEIMNPAVKGLKFNFVIENRKALGLPSFETITRARRKVQAVYPSLRACKEVEEARAGLEEEFKAFARV